MDLPRSSSDIRLATACPVCLGNGGFGPRVTIREKIQTSCFNSCSTCDGTGWQLDFLPDLPAPLAQKVRNKLAPIPPDADTAHHQDAAREQLTTTLTRRWIESITLPEGNATHIDIHGKRGEVLRLHPEFTAGKFRNLTITPIPPSP